MLFSGNGSFYFLMRFLILCIAYLNMPTRIIIVYKSMQVRETSSIHNTEEYTDKIGKLCMTIVQLKGTVVLDRTHKYTMKYNLNFLYVFRI